MKRNSTLFVGIFLLSTVMFIGHATAQICIEPPAGLVSWWLFDEVSGNLTEDIVGSDDGAGRPE